MPDLLILTGSDAAEAAAEAAAIINKLAIREIKLDFTSKQYHNQN